MNCEWKRRIAKNHSLEPLSSSFIRTISIKNLLKLRKLVCFNSSTEFLLCVSFENPMNWNEKCNGTKQHRSSTTKYNFIFPKIKKCGANFTTCYLTWGKTVYIFWKSETISVEKKKVGLEVGGWIFSILFYFLFIFCGESAEYL